MDSAEGSDISHLSKIIRLRHSDKRLKQELYINIASALKGSIGFMYSQILSLSIETDHLPSDIASVVFTQSEKYFPFARSQHKEQIMNSIAMMVKSFRYNHKLVDKYSNNIEGLIEILGLSNILDGYEDIIIGITDGMIHIILPSKDYLIGKMKGAEGGAHFRDMYLDNNSMEVTKAVFIVSVERDAVTLEHERLHAISYCTLYNLHQPEINRNIQNELVAYINEIYQQICASGLRGKKLKKFINDEIAATSHKLCTHPLYLPTFIKNELFHLDINISNYRSQLDRLKKMGCDQKIIDEIELKRSDLECRRESVLDVGWYTMLIETSLDRGVAYLRSGGTIDPFLLIPLDDWDEFLPRKPRRSASKIHLLD